MKAMTCKSDINGFLKAVKDGEAVWSPKLDGVRVLAVVEENKTVKYYSRAEKEFKNFGVFDEELIGLAATVANLAGWKYPVIFDGEAMDKDGKFSKIMTQVHRIKEVDESILRFRIFDIVPQNKARFFERYGALNFVFDASSFEGQFMFDKISLVKHTLLKNPSKRKIKRLGELLIKFGYEGAVLKNAYSLYEHKKSSHWLKVKNTDTLDLKVIGFEYGGGRNEGRLGALVCDFKGVEVSVGSGFSDEQRIEFVKNLPAIIEVEFQEILPSGSLRFPVFVRVRNDKLESEAA